MILQSDDSVSYCNTAQHLMKTLLNSVNLVSVVRRKLSSAKAYIAIALWEKSDSLLR